MTVFRRVISREVDDMTVTETLECGHENTLYRRVQGNRVAWCNQQSVPTNLSTSSRECSTCQSEQEQKDRGWEL